MTNKWEEIRTKIAADPAMKPLVEQIEFPMPTEGRDPYFDLVRTIVFQQLSTKAAQTIFNRFLELFDDKWPHPDRLTRLDMEPMRRAGLSRQKATYVQNVAAFFLEEKLLSYDWAAQEDEAILHLLTRIKGVGNWTAEMILMFTLNRPDIFPVDDLGIQTALAKLYALPADLKEKKKRMIEIAEAWRPYRTFGSKYLWRYLDLGLWKP